MDLEYLMLEKRIVEPANLGAEHYDVLISAFNQSPRVKDLFSGLPADRKIWIAHPEYKFVASDVPGPSEDIYAPTDRIPETEFWLDFFDWIRPSVPDTAIRIAVDITGMLRPHILLLPLFLRKEGFACVDFLYSDPVGYLDGTGTVFSKGVIERVAQVPGLEGAHDPRIASELLIIGAGYDSRLVAELARSRAQATHMVLLGLPGLQPHMYQESQLKVAGVREAMSRLTERSFAYSPANDPWLTAATLRDTVARVRREGDVNLYLAPVGPKSQVLGFGWYFLTDERSNPTSMLFPYTSEYSRETSHGLARTHFYTLELDWIIDPTP